MLVLGDMNTAFLPGKVSTFSIDGDRTFGPGIAEMQGGSTVAVFALIPSLVDRAALLAAAMHKLGAGAWEARGNG